MRVGKDKLRRRRRFFTILILFSFIISALPGGMKNIRAEELSGQEPVETVELAAEVIWTGMPDEMTIPNTTLKLMSGENVVESIKVTDGSLEVKFTPVAKFNDVGEEVLYSVSQDPLENFTTEIRDFVVENTYVEPVVVADNRYANPAVVRFTAQKLLDNKTPLDNQFTFMLTDADGAVLQTKRNLADGVTFDDIVIKETGTKVYFLKEEKGSNPLIQYDPAVYKITINVSKNSTGDYVATSTIEVSGKIYSGIPIFKNKTIIRELPKTGEAQSMLPILGVVLLLGGVTLNLKRKKTR